MKKKETVRQNHPGIVQLSIDLIELFGLDISIENMTLSGDYLKVVYKPNHQINRWDLEFEITELLDNFKDQFGSEYKLTHNDSIFKGRSWLEVIAQ